MIKTAGRWVGLPSNALIMLQCSIYNVSAGALHCEVGDCFVLSKRMKLGLAADVGRLWCVQSCATHLLAHN